MRTFIALLAATLLLPLAFAQPAETDLGQRVWVRPLTANTWLVRSVSKLGQFGDVESNALLATGSTESVLIDTPATNEQTEAILDWAANQLHRPLRHLVITHWHADRMGGIGAAHARRIDSYAFGKTIEFARQQNLTRPKHELKPEDHLTLSGVELETFYPGHGHTADNILVWLPKEQLLDGGCFIKSAAATTLGNMQEINPPEWAKGIAAVQQRYAKATTVIPGHGAVGGQELLEHTAELLEKENATAYSPSTLGRVKAKLERSTRVPVRLPGALPYVNAKQSVYAVFRSLEPSRYSILLANGLPCEGQNVCSYGTLDGSANPITLGTEVKPRPVTLRNGIKAQYYKTVCYAYCSNAYITWQEGQFHYAIGMKAGELDELISAANSAIPQNHK